MRTHLTDTELKNLTRIYCVHFLLCVFEFQWEYSINHIFHLENELTAWVKSTPKIFLNLFIYLWFTYNSRHHFFTLHFFCCHFRSITHSISSHKNAEYRSEFCYREEKLWVFQFFFWQNIGCAWIKLSVFGRTVHLFRSICFANFMNSLSVLGNILSYSVTQFTKHVANLIRILNRNVFMSTARWVKQKLNCEKGVIFLRLLMVWCL